jgi:hypothetical protein
VLGVHGADGNDVEDPISLDHVVIEMKQRSKL